MSRLQSLSRSLENKQRAMRPTLVRSTTQVPPMPMCQADAYARKPTCQMDAYLPTKCRRVLIGKEHSGITGRRVAYVE